MPGEAAKKGGGAKKVGGQSTLVGVTRQVFRKELATCDTAQSRAEAENEHITGLLLKARQIAKLTHARAEKAEGELAEHLRKRTIAPKSQAQEDNVRLVAENAQLIAALEKIRADQITKAKEQKAKAARDKELAEHDAKFAASAAVATAAAKATIEAERQAELELQKEAEAIAAAERAAASAGESAGESCVESARVESAQGAGESERTQRDDDDLDLDDLDLEALKALIKSMRDEFISKLESSREQVICFRPPHPFLPYVAPHSSHISHFNLGFQAKKAARQAEVRVTLKHEAEVFLLF